MNTAKRNIIFLAIVLISTVMHWPHFSKDLMSIHVWRQAETQSTIINFYEEDMNILNPRRNDRGDTDGILRMEFPLMQWLTACLYKIFGNHMVITRLFMFLTGIITLLGLFRLLYTLFRNVTLALMGASAMNFSPAFYYYTINPLPDNLALCFSVWGLAMFFTWYRNQKKLHLILSGLLLSLGTLCKVPFIIYFILPTAYFIQQFRRKARVKDLIRPATGMYGFLIFPLAWYATVIPQWNGPKVLRGIFHDDVSFSVLLDYFQHNLFSTLPELLLNYASLPFFLAGFYFLNRNRAYKKPLFIPLFALSVGLILFYVYEAYAIAKIHDYYLFPFYPVLFILVAYGAWNLISVNKGFKYLTYILLLALPFTCYFRMSGRWNPDSPGFNKDLLQYKSELRQAVPKESLVVAGNDISHFIFFYYIDKKGWGYDNDHLNAEKLRSMMEKGAEYLYTDSEKIANNSKLTPYFDELILEKGSVKVYKLKRINNLEL